MCASRAWALCFPSIAAVRINLPHGGVFFDKFALVLSSLRRKLATRILAATDLADSLLGSATALAENCRNEECFAGFRRSEEASC